MPKGAGWKTPMLPRVSIMPVVSRVSMVSEGMPDEMGGRDRSSVVRAIAYRCVCHEFLYQNPISGSGQPKSVVNSAVAAKGQIGKHACARPSGRAEAAPAAGRLRRGQRPSRAPRAWQPEPDVHGRARRQRAWLPRARRSEPVAPVQGTDLQGPRVCASLCARCTRVDVFALPPPLPPFYFKHVR